MAKGFIKSNEVIYKDENGIERKRTELKVTFETKYSDDLESDEF